MNEEMFLDFDALYSEACKENAFDWVHTVDLILTLDKDRNTLLNQVMQTFLFFCPNQTTEQNKEKFLKIMIALLKRVSVSSKPIQSILLEHLVTTPNVYGDTLLSLAAHLPAPIYKKIFEFVRNCVQGEFIRSELYRTLLIDGRSVHGTLTQATLRSGTEQHLAILLQEFNFARQSEWVFESDIPKFLIGSGPKSGTTIELACSCTEPKIRDLYFSTLQSAIARKEIMPRDAVNLFPSLHKIRDSFYYSPEAFEQVRNIMNFALQKSESGADLHPGLFLECVPYTEFPHYRVDDHLNGFFEYYFSSISKFIAHGIYDPSCVRSLFTRATGQGFRLVDQLISWGTDKEFQAALNFLNHAFKQKWITAEAYVKILTTHKLSGHSIFHELVYSSDMSNHLEKLKCYANSLLQLKDCGLLSYEYYKGLFTHNNKCKFSVASQSVNNVNCDVAMFMIDLIMGSLSQADVQDVLLSKKYTTRTPRCEESKKHASTINGRLNELRRESQLSTSPRFFGTRSLRSFSVGDQEQDQRDSLANSV